MKYLLIISTIFFFVGCSTNGVAVDKLNVALYSLKGAAESSLPRGLRKKSINGRVFYSNYFLKIGKNLSDASKLSRRKYAKITILGDRRPYTVEVVVFSEKKISDKRAVQPRYEVTGHDKRLAKALTKKMLKKLSKGHKGMNIIDEFRVF